MYVWRATFFVSCTKLKHEDRLKAIKKLYKGNLSEETDEWGKPLVKASDGTVEFGFIEDGYGLQPAPIRLSLGENKKNPETGEDEGYGLLHILARHGEQIKFYASVTVKQDGLEVSVSSHYLNKNKVSRAMQEGKVLYAREALLPNSSEWRLAEHHGNGVPDLLPTQWNNASFGNKGSKNTSNPLEKDDILTFRDGTPIPVDENGEADLSSMDAEHAAEWYIDNLGADAKEVVGRDVAEAKKALDDAMEMKMRVAGRQR